MSAPRRPFVLGSAALGVLAAAGSARAQTAARDGVPEANTAAPAPAAPAVAGDAVESGVAAADDSFAAPGTPDSGDFFGGEAEVARLLDLSGFADFTFATLVGNEDSSWPDAYLKAASFYVGNLNVYINSQISERVRSLIEVRFMYLPQGQLQSDGEPIVLEDLGRGTPGALSYTDTSVSDYSDFGREIDWGGIRIERASVEYTFGSALVLSAGQWLTPYGIWNVDHGSPTLIAVRRPLIVSQELFPEHQTGLQASGRMYVGNSTLGYHLTVSNGRGPLAEYQDLDQNKAVGGRLLYQVQGKSELELGASFYQGRYTSRGKELAVTIRDGEPLIKLQSPLAVQYDEVALGADLRWQYRALVVQSEVLFNDVRFTPGHRPPATASIEPNGLIADFRTGGAYLLLGCRTPWLGLMPYVLAETHAYNEQDYLERGYMTTMGVNWRLEPSLVVKVEYGSLYFDGPNLSAIRDALAQVAWAF